MQHDKVLRLCYVVLHRALLCFPQLALVLPLILPWVAALVQYCSQHIAVCKLLYLLLQTCKCAGEWSLCKRAGEWAF